MTTNMNCEAPENEEAAMAWWTSLTEPERAQALKDASWKSGGTFTPSAADVWSAFAHRPLMAAATRKLLRYVVIVNDNGFSPYLYDTQTKTKIVSYPTTAEAERQAALLNRFIRPAGGEGRVRHVAVGDPANDVDAYLETFGADSDTFIECDECGGMGSVEAWDTGPNNHRGRCDACDGTGRVRAPDVE